MNNKGADQTGLHLGCSQTTENKFSRIKAHKGACALLGSNMVFPIDEKFGMMSINQVLILLWVNKALFGGYPAH